MTVASNEQLISAAPPWAVGFHSDDLDEVRSFVRRSDGEHSRAAHAPGALGYEFYFLSGAVCKLGWGRMAIGQTIRGAVPVPSLHIAVPAGSVYRVGRREHASSPNSAMFIAPHWDFTRSSPPGEMVGLNVRGKSLAQEIDARRPGRGGDEPVLRTQLLSFAVSERAELLSAYFDMVQATPESSAVTRPHAEARLLALIADLVLRRGMVPRGQAVSAARIAELEAWVDSHLDEPLTMGRLCAVSGVGERCLQKAFYSRRGMSPMRFVAERRLAAARARLLHAGPRDDVTSVAVELGFGHVGRFAQLYRQAFGESPSETLRRVGVRTRARG
ncbi:MAG: helix-turn-helix domain-containing protein [Burkholderiaceae bacterium]